MTKTISAAGILSLALLSGCASLTGGTAQNITVNTQKSGLAISGAHCKLSNDKGEWEMTTPASVMVHRSSNDLLIHCDKDDQPQGILTVKPTMKPMTMGNIIFGGAVGAGIDQSTGAAYDYPAKVTVELGQTLTYTPSAQTGEQTLPGINNATASGTR